MNAETTNPSPNASSSGHTDAETTAVDVLCTKFTRQNSMNGPEDTGTDLKYLSCTYVRLHVYFLI